MYVKKTEPRKLGGGIDVKELLLNMLNKGGEIWGSVGVLYRLYGEE